MKISSLAPYALITSLFLVASAIAVSVAFAAPTQAPPNGNPSFPLTGPTGPAGPTGPQGPQGTPGTAATLDCNTQTQNFTGTSITVSCGGGYVATGGGFYLSDGDNNGLNWNNAWAYPSGNTGWQCGRNVYSGLTSSCYVRCCRLQ